MARKKKIESVETPAEILISGPSAYLNGPSDPEYAERATEFWDKQVEAHEGISEEEIESLLTVEDLLHVHVRPRFPIAVMHWYKQYSNPESARAGTIEYAMSLTEGLTEEAAGLWIDKLLSEQGSAPEVVVKPVVDVDVPSD